MAFFNRPHLIEMGGLMAQVGRGAVNVHEALCNANKSTWQSPRHIRH